MITTFTIISSATVVASLTAYVVARKIRRFKSDKVLIEFKIGTTDGFYYNIEAQKLPINMDPNERLRLMIGFIVKLLAYADKNNAKEKSDILRFLGEISKHQLSSKVIDDYFKKEFAFELYVRLAKVEGKVISGQFLAKGSEREFVPTIPPGIFKYQLLFSVASLLSFVTERLDANHLELLQQSLKYVVESLQHPISFVETPTSDLSNLENEAYAAAKVEDYSKKIKFG